MSANVARTVAGRRGFAPGGRAARVTHALLVIAVTVVPPGVHGICMGGPVPGGPHACCAGPSAAAAPAGAVAATRCCGSHAIADPRPPTDASSTDRGPTGSLADAADGGPSLPGGCRCSPAPRDREGDGRVPRTVATVALSRPAGIRAEVVKIVMAPVDSVMVAPARPVRVLYGVWRN